MVLNFELHTKTQWGKNEFGEDVEVVIGQIKIGQHVVFEVQEQYWGNDHFADEVIGKFAKHLRLQQPESAAEQMTIRSRNDRLEGKK